MNMKKLRYLQYTIPIITIIFYSSLTAQETSTLTDSRDVVVYKSDGVDYQKERVYKTVKIGDQWWMAENLKYPPRQSSVDGQRFRRIFRHDRSTNTSYYVTYMGYNFSESYVPVYGYLYDWETAMNACPDDWHLPSHDEWYQLANYLGKKNAGTKMRAQGTSHWTFTNRKTPATNSSGFTALPGGRYDGWLGEFSDLGKVASFWSGDGITAWYLNGKRKRIDWNAEGHQRYVYGADYRSVRCVKD